MSHNILLVLILYALANQLLVCTVADLPQDEADFVLEETWLGFVVGFGDEPAERLDALRGGHVAHIVQHTVFLE
jgi:hypothetical protein